MIINNLENKTNILSKILYTLHLAGFGFFLRWVSQNSFIYLFLIVPILIVIQVRYGKPIDDVKNPWKDTLLIFLIFVYGVSGLWNFTGHFFLTEQVANSIGWTESPFQIELAGYHLAFGLISLLSLWNRNIGYWGAVVHSMPIFLFTAGGLHVYEIIEFQNYNPGNADYKILLGTFLYPILIIFVFWNFKRKVKSWNKN